MLLAILPPPPGSAHLPTLRQATGSHRRRPLANTWFLLLLAAFASTPALAAAPVLSHLFPAGGQRGTKVAVTATGTFTWPVQVQAPGVEVTVGADSGKLEITIPADLPTDRVWIRLTNAEGVSAPYPFLINTLPEVNETEPNNRLGEAGKLPEGPVLVNGVLSGAEVDCFAVPLKKGQTLVAHCEANTQLGSPIDAMLQLVTPQGTVVAENNDEQHLDPRVVFTAPADGVYVARLFAFPSTPGTNIAYAGGANCVYRLTLTTGPFLAHAVPLAAERALAEKPETRPQVAVVGWNLPAELKLPVLPLGGEALAAYPEFDPIDELRNSGESRIGLVWQAGIAGSARVRLLGFAPVAGLAGGPVEQPAAVPFPACVTGQFSTPRQRLAYTVPLKKGEPILLSCESRSLNLLVDPLVKLIDPTGATVMELDDSGSQHDLSFAHTPAHDGDYKVIVRDRYDQAGPGCAFRLTVRPERPDLELTLATDAIALELGKPLELPVKLARRGGPGAAIAGVSVSVMGLPAHVTCAAVVSEPTGPTAGEVKLSLTSEGGAFQGPIRVVGTAVEPAGVVRTARTPAKLGATGEVVWLTVPEKK